MDDFLKGRQSVDTYTLFFDTFMPCVTKKSSWITQIAKAGIKKDAKGVVCLCTVSDEAFALLLMENSFDRWLDLYRQGFGNAKQQQHRRSKDRGFHSNVSPLYTSGGIKYESTEGAQSFKGWSDEGRLRFNALFDYVKQDRQANPSFETNWLESRREKQEALKKPSKERHQAVMTRSELFDSEDEEEVNQTVDNNDATAADDSDSDNDKH